MQAKIQVFPATRINSDTLVWQQVVQQQDLSGARRVFEEQLLMQGSTIT